MSSLDKYVIHQPKPYRLAIFILIAVMITATSVWFLLKEDSISLQQNLNYLQQNLNLSRQNTQQLNIQQATVEHQQQQLVELQDQVIKLNKELLFYQNITQGATSTELQIRELHLTADADQSDIIHYRLVITQGKKITKPVTGSVSINLDTNPTVISEQPLNLRYVQLIEGRLKLAENSHPKLITITIKPDKKSKLSRTFDWQLTSTIK
jgi:TolA-binding protein